MAQRRPEPEPSSTAFVASARRIHVGGGTAAPAQGQSMGLAKPDERQRQSWLYFDAIPEVKQATYFLANTMSLVRIYVALQVDDEQEPQAPDNTTAPGYFEAQDALDRLRQGNGGHGWFMRGGTLNLCIPGEFYLVGYPEVAAREPDPRHRGDVGAPAQPERFRVHSTSELVKDGEGPSAKTLVKARPSDKGTQLPADAYVLRVWQEHPEYSDLADSALLGALAECEELVILSRVVRATGRSRLAGNGMLVVPNEFTVKRPTPPQGDDNDPSADPFNDALMEAMITPIADEGHPSAVVPLVLRGPAEHIDKVKHFHMDRPLDAEAREGRRELLDRLGSGLDIPMEVLTGMAKVNHWTAWQVDQSTWTRYGQPKAIVLCEALTAGYLRPYLEEAGLAPEVAAQFVVWFDPGGAISDPDMTASAKEAHDRMVISDSAYRNAVGFSDADAPDDAEIQARIERAIAMKAAGGGANGQGPPNDGTPPAGPQSRLVRLLKRGSRRGNGTTAAAGPAPIGVRLAALDRALRMRIDEAAQAAMQRTLERAGARVRNKAAKVAALRDMVSREPAHLVCAVLGPNTVNTALAIPDADLLAGGLDGLAARFNSKVTDAQAQVRAMLRDEYDLTDGELADLQRQQDQDRHAAWLWFSAAMAALAAEKLYHPTAEAQAGEFDVTALVPPGLVREALVRAGGGDVVAAGTLGPQAAPPGGVGLGQLVRDVWAAHGQVVTGWTWLYGDPSSRGTPFNGHMDLDGQGFAAWDDPVLAVQDDDSWLGVDYYRPGDHPWCQCDFAPDVGPADAGADQGGSVLVGAE